MLNTVNNNLLCDSYLFSVFLFLLIFIIKIKVVFFFTIKCKEKQSELCTHHCDLLSEHFYRLKQKLRICL